MSDSVTLWTVAPQTSLAFNISHSLLKLMSTESVMPFSHLILCLPLLFLPSVFPNIKVFFQWISSLHQVTKESELQLQHQSFQWIIQGWFPLGLTGLISCSPGDSQESFPTPQFKSINSLVLSLLDGPTLTSIHVGKAIALTIQTLVCQVISLLFNMLSRIVIAFLPRSKCLNFVAAVIL